MNKKRNYLQYIIYLIYVFSLVIFILNNYIAYYIIKKISSEEYSYTWYGAFCTIPCSFCKPSLWEFCFSLLVIFIPFALIRLINHSTTKNNFTSLIFHFCNSILLSNLLFSLLSIFNSIKKINIVDYYFSNDLLQSFSKNISGLNYFLPLLLSVLNFAILFKPLKKNLVLYVGLTVTGTLITIIILELFFHN